MRVLMDRNRRALRLEDNLLLKRCPHCKTASPNISAGTEIEAKEPPHGLKQFWRLYFCSVCTYGILAQGQKKTKRDEEVPYIRRLYPALHYDLSEHIPEKAIRYLSEARDTLSSPSSSIFASSTSIDAMLIEKKVEGDTLYKRIQAAEEKNLFSKDMSTWANQIRLRGNEQRHPESSESLPTTQDAKDCLEYAMMLAEILFVIPARVEAGINETKEEEEEEEEEEGKRKKKNG